MHLGIYLTHHVYLFFFFYCLHLSSKYPTIRYPLALLASQLASFIPGRKEVELPFYLNAVLRSYLIAATFSQLTLRSYLYAATSSITRSLL